MIVLTRPHPELHAESSTSFIDAELTPNVSVHLKTPQQKGPYLSPEALQKATKLSDEKKSAASLDEESGGEKKSSSSPLKVPKWLKLKK